MSEGLIWEVMRKNNSKALLRTHPVHLFTTEKGTLLNNRSKPDSGLARRKAVDVTINDEGIPVLSIKNAKEEDLRNPDKMWRIITLSGGVRKALAKTDAVLSVYNPSMKKPAMRKVSASYKALARKNKAIDS